MDCSGKLSKAYDPGKKITDKSVFLGQKESPFVNISIEIHFFKHRARLGGLFLRV